MRRFILQSIAAIGGTLIVASSIALAQAPAAAPPVRVRATIEKVEGDRLLVKLNSGDNATIVMPENVRVLGIEKAGISDVTVGNYVGISSVPLPDGTQGAIHIHIFLEAQRGVAEGHFPWDNKPGSMMTNAAVESAVAGKDGQMLTVKYKTGDQRVVVSPDTIIVKYVPGDKSDLKPGARIFIAGAARQPDGSLRAMNISVGRDGLIPPM